MWPSGSAVGLEGGPPETPSTAPAEAPSWAPPPPEGPPLRPPKVPDLPLGQGVLDSGDGETQCPWALSPSDGETLIVPGPQRPKTQGGLGHKASWAPLSPAPGRGLSQLADPPPAYPLQTHRKPGFLASPGNSFPAPSQLPRFPVWKRVWILPR